MKHQRKHLDVEVMGDKHVRGEGQCICWGSSREKKTALGISWTRVRVEKGGQNPGWTGEKPGKSSRRSEKKSDEENNEDRKCSQTKPERKLEGGGIFLL